MKNVFFIIHLFFLEDITVLLAVLNVKLVPSKKNVPITGHILSKSNYALEIEFSDFFTGAIHRIFKSSIGHTVYFIFISFSLLFKYSKDILASKGKSRSFWYLYLFDFGCCIFI